MTRAERHPWHAAGWAGGLALCAVALISWLGVVPLSLAAGVLVPIVLSGYVSGWLLVSWEDEAAPLQWAVVRSVCGLLLSTMAFLASLRFGLPWYVGPLLVLLAALGAGRAAAVRPPLPRVSWNRDGAVATVLALLLVAPLVVASVRMAPGPFPPMFFNVDTPYFLEKVHALVHAREFPPASLSNAGGRPLYHYAVHGMAALVSRSSRLAPHHALFLVVLPLLAAGLVASAFAAARVLAPRVPRSLAVPLLLVTVPSLWYAFWSVAGPMLGAAWRSGEAGPLLELSRNVEMWGPASVVGHNVAAQFVVLSGLAAFGLAERRGWRLPVFLAGTAVLVKASTGVALVAGLLAAQAVRALAARHWRPLGPALGAVLVCGATYALFFIVPGVPAAFRTELWPLFHLRLLAERNGLASFAVDLAWLLLPGLVIWSRPRDLSAPAWPLLLLGLAPFAVVNLTRSVDVRPGAGGATDDWVQVLLPVPFLLHAFVLAAASDGWLQVARARRAAFALLVLLTTVPVLAVSGRYAALLAAHPQDGHEFVDNRPLAEALAAIPTAETLIVTNDLRYPAQRFSRDFRQMQIPALFGHQAFAVNYAYERESFSDERRQLQPLLQAADWDDRLFDVARRQHWTHLLIRRDYPHPEPVPLEPTFANRDYVVYAFALPRRVDASPGRASQRVVVE